MRLDKLLWQSGLTSKKKIKKVIQMGQVRIDGKPATSIRQNVDSSIQEILLGDLRIKDTEHIYYMLNKPRGVVTAVSDAKLPTVMDLLAPSDKSDDLYHIGRLDRSTEGLLLLTNNGPLGLRMLHPDHHISKTYLVEANACLDWRAVVRFDQGIVFRDGTRCRPAKLTLLETSPGFTRATVTLSEGKFHQVKKMFLAVGAKVTALKRLRFGPFTLDGSLQPGEYRSLTAEERLLLKPYFD